MNHEVTKPNPAENNGGNATWKKVKEETIFFFKHFKGLSFYLIKYVAMG